MLIVSLLLVSLPKCSRLELMRYARVGERFVSCVRRQLDVKKRRKVLVGNDVLKGGDIESSCTLENVLVRPTWILELHSESEIMDDDVGDKQGADMRNVVFGKAKKISPASPLSWILKLFQNLRSSLYLQYVCTLHCILILLVCRTITHNKRSFYFFAHTTVPVCKNIMPPIEKDSKCQQRRILIDPGISQYIHP